MAALCDLLLNDPFLTPFGLGGCGANALSCGGLRTGRGLRRHGPVKRSTGWDLEVPVPGFAASDITVELSADNQELRVHALPHFSASYSLPEGADAANTAASCVDGVLKVVVPRLPEPAPTPVEVSGAPLPTKHEGDAERQLFLPGVPGRDVKVEVTGRTLRVTAGERSDDFDVPRTADLSATTASYVNGVLTLRVPRAAPAEVAVTETAIDPKEYDLVIEAAVPGYAAADVSVERVGTEAVRAALETERGARAVWHAAVPRGAEVVASVTNGLLRVAAAAPAAEERGVTAIAVSDTVPAALPKTP